MSDFRDRLGKVAREAHRQALQERENVPEQWLIRYEQMPEENKEEYRRIGEAVVNYVMERMVQ